MFLKSHMADYGPPKDFVDSKVYVYKLDGNGNKVLVRTEEPYPRLQSITEKQRARAGKVNKLDSVLPKAAKMREQGMSHKEIAEKLGVNHNTLYYHLKKY